MTTVDKVKALCKERKIPISKLERELGYANGYIGQLRKGTFPNNRLVEIADYLKVSVAYLTGQDENKPAPEGELDEKRKQLIQFIRTTDDKMIDILWDIAERVKSSGNK